MSRIGIKPISVPAGVDVTIADGNLVTVKGPKGTLTKKLHGDMIIKNDAGVLTRGQDAQVTARSDKNTAQQHG